jgi:hypothetical protein
MSEHSQAMEHQNDRLKGVLDSITIIKDQSTLINIEIEDQTQ